VLLLVILRFRRAANSAITMRHANAIAVVPICRIRVAKSTVVGCGRSKWRRASLKLVLCLRALLAGLMVLAVVLLFAVLSCRGLCGLMPDVPCSAPAP